MNELSMSIIMLTVVKNFELFVLILAVWRVYYSSIKHHKLKRRVELKNRKRLEILKNQYINFLLDGLKKNLCRISFLLSVHGNFRYMLF